VHSWSSLGECLFSLVGQSWDSLGVSIIYCIAMSLGSRKIGCLT
jgi:hypothetical protein